MKKTTIFLIICIIILLALLILVLYTYYSDYKRAKESVLDKILTAHLEGFKPGVTIERNMKGEEKTVFKKGEWLGIAGTIQANQDSELTFKIFDLNENLIASNNQWKTDIKKGQGEFGMCCVEVPSEIGQYKVNLYLDNNLMETLNFSVTE